MCMWLVVVTMVFSIASLSGAQTATTAVTSDPKAVSLAQESLVALSGGRTIADLTLHADVTSIVGSDDETGTAVFRAKGSQQSRVDVNVTKGTISEARTVANGRAAGAWNKNGGASVMQAAHNMVTDATWFFPALSCLAQFNNPNYVFTYVGQAQHGGIRTEHIRVSEASVAGAPFAAHLSMTEFFLSSTTSLPIAIDFSVHPDNDMNKDIPVEILFANWQPVNGILVPFHFQKLLNGSVILDASVTSVNMNTGIADSVFTLP